jgi:hypothetical protein
MEKFWDNAIQKGQVVARPRSGKCILCGTQLTMEDKDHSVCNKCWTITFTCGVCGGEIEECEHGG